MPKSSGAICLTWDPQCRRIESLARELEMPLHVIHVLSYRKPLLAPIKYMAMTVLTLRLLLRLRPAVVVTVVPPLPSAVVVHLYGMITGARLVIDAQTGAFSNPLWSWAEPVFKWLCRKALLTTVTNPELGQVLASWKAAGMVLEDPIPVLAEGESPQPSNAIRVAVVNSYANDEPLQETIEAANQCGTYEFYVTGRLSNAPKSLLKEAGKHIHFTDYLSEERYGALMRECDLVVVLSTRENTMLCGSFEAMSVGKPLVTSKWIVTERRFTKGTVFVDNTAEGIRDGIREAVTRRDELSRGMAELCEEVKIQQRANIEKFKALLLQEGNS